MKSCLIILASVILCAACSRKVTQSASETSSSAAVGTETTLTGERVDLRRLADVLALTLSTRVETMDSTHIRTHTLTTLDAEGNVIGSTREETSDRWSRSSGIEASDRAEEHLQSDSAASRDTAIASARSEAVTSSEERTQTAVRSVPWWERVIGSFSGTLLVAATIAAAGAGVSAAVRRWRAKRRL